MYLNVDLGNAPPKKAYYHRFTQIIFSKQTIAAPAATAPAWFTAQTAGTWNGVATTGTPDAVKPSPEPFVGFSTLHARSLTSWSGASVDQARREYLLTANGGHADYPGNEVYALALGLETPAWRRLIDPTPNAQMPQSPPAFNEGDGLYNDGRPRSMHNCFQKFANGKVWMGVQNSVTSGGGGDYNRVLAFNREYSALLAADGTRGTGGTGSPLAWTAANIGPWELYTGSSGWNSSAGAFGKQLYNPRDKYMYCLGGKSGNGTVYYWRIDTTTGAASAVQTHFISGTTIGRFQDWAVLVPDIGPSGVIIAGCTSQTPVIAVFDISKFGQAGAWSQHSSYTGTPYFSTYVAGSGGEAGDGVYLSPFRQVAIGNPPYIGSQMYKLQLPATTTVAGLLAATWSWSNFTPTGGTGISATGIPGSWGKWELIENMGNGQSAIVYAGGTTSPTFVYKVPTTGLP